MLIFSITAFSQAAGNWIDNQAKVKGGYGSVSISNSNTEQSFEGYYQSNNYSRSGYSKGADTVIEIQARILMNVKADAFHAIFGVSQVCDSIESGHELINQRIEHFTKALLKLGIKKEDIHIDFISQVPVFEYAAGSKLFSKTYNEIPKGFELKKNIHLTYYNDEIADKILIAAAKNEIYDIIKVDHIVSDLNSVYSTMRDTAIYLLNSKVDDFKKLGLTFIPQYHTIAESIYSSYPIERYERYGTFNYASLSAIEKKTDNPYKASNQSSSLFYNKINYNTYELVINPVTKGPVVQFTYTLKMQYALKKQ
ncbi:MAG: hypothetical protein C0594_11410 [Marinilabiliales bacterium]|nr:MAG: hypothetical protein C0594_11410 [Marinilabiliales bacterium]